MTLISCNICFVQNFPNMNACMAFEFVFKVTGNCRVANSNQLSQKILVKFLSLKSIFFSYKEIHAFFNSVSAFAPLSSFSSALSVFFVCEAVGYVLLKNSSPLLYAS